MGINVMYYCCGAFWGSQEEYEGHLVGEHCGGPKFEHPDYTTQMKMREEKLDWDELKKNTTITSFKYSPRDGVIARFCEECDLNNLGFHVIRARS